jgi:hypothetical protein
MADTKLAVFTIGQGKAIPVDHTGPVSYSTGGETIGQINNQTGITVQGLGVLDDVVGAGLSVSGSYWVLPQPVGTGERKTYKLLWFTASAGVPTLTQVSAAVNLSAETVRLTYIGR